MKIELSLEEIKILINWAEYKNADLPFNTDENLLKQKLETYERSKDGKEESRTEEPTTDKGAV